MVQLKENLLKQILNESDGIYLMESLPEGRVGIYNSYLSGYVVLQQETADIAATVVGNIIFILVITCSGLGFIDLFFLKLVIKFFK